MSLADRIPGDQRSISEKRIVNILWMAGAAFVFIISALLLLNRLGLPTYTVVNIAGAILAFAVLVLSWMGRTMNGPLYFFADRLAGIAPAGLSGLSDWVGGAFLITFLASTLTMKLALAPAVMLGLLLQAALFSGVFQRSGVATVPGFFAWRYQRQLVALIPLVVTTLILGLLAAGELMVARDVLLIISELSAPNATWLVLAIAILPSVFGGWLSLLIVNSVMVIWAMVCVLAPAVITGFLPGVLQAAGAIREGGIDTLPLNIASGPTFGLAEAMVSANTAEIFVTILVLGAGFSILPHALSRAGLAKRPVAAIESIGWTALGAFLVFSALPLSLILIGQDASTDNLAQLLQNQPVLHLLPYFAILFVAINGLAVTLFVLSSTLVRAFRRSRNLNPGEQSMFSTRLLGILFVTLLGFAPTEYLNGPGTLLLGALMLSAGGLFIPITAMVWVAKIPAIAMVAASLFGTITTGAILAFQLPWIRPLFGTELPFTIDGLSSLIQAGLAGMLTATLVILVGRLFAALSGSDKDTSNLERLRNPDTMIR